MTKISSIPKGENYEKLRALKIAPPNLSNPSKRELLLYVDVDVPHGKKGRIGIYRGDDLQKLVISNITENRLRISAKLSILTRGW